MINDIFNQTNKRIFNTIFSFFELSILQVAIDKSKAIVGVGINDEHGHTRMIKLKVECTL